MSKPVTFPSGLTLVEARDLFSGVVVSGGLLATPFNGDQQFRVNAATLNRLGLTLSPMLPTRFISDPYMRVIPTDAGRAKVAEIKAARAAKETP